MRRAFSVPFAFGLLVVTLTGCTGGPGPLPDDQTGGTASGERPPPTGEAGNPVDGRGPGQGGAPGSNRGPEDDDRPDEDDLDDSEMGDRDGG